MRGGQNWPKSCATGARHGHRSPAAFCRDEPVNMRVAFRLAHDMTQHEVAVRLNKLFPAEDRGAGVTAQHVSYWETWPQTGRSHQSRPISASPASTKCAIGDLIEDSDYSHLDEADAKGGTRGR